MVIKKHYFLGITFTKIKIPPRLVNRFAKIRMLTSLEIDSASKSVEKTMLEPTEIHPGRHRWVDQYIGLSFFKRTDSVRTVLYNVPPSCGGTGLVSVVASTVFSTEMDST